MEVERLKLIGFGTASLVTGAAVAVSGIIGFVGLLVPHLIRLIWRRDFRFLLPLCALGGATLLVAADLLSRTIVTSASFPSVRSRPCGRSVFPVVLRRRDDARLETFDTIAMVAAVRDVKPDHRRAQSSRDGAEGPQIDAAQARPRARARGGGCSRRHALARGRKGVCEARRHLPQIRSRVPMRATTWWCRRAAYSDGFVGDERDWRKRRERSSSGRGESRGPLYGEMSGGARKRVSWARSWRETVSSCSMSASALDPRTCSSSRNAPTGRGPHGCTVVFAAHD